MNTLEQHLAAHQLGQRIDNNTLVCTCGDFVRDMPGTYDDPYREHRAHVAASWQEARTVRTVEELALADDPIDWNAHSFLDEIVEREPWRILRAVDAMIRGHWNFDGHDSGRLLALADELEREHDEKAKRDRLIVRAKEVYAATMGHETALAAVVDAVLAEVVDQ